MANEEHLAKLREGVAPWNSWREEHRDVTPSLSNADLRGANLRAANLSEANLRSANLREADMSGARLSSANLSAADLRRANLSGADLRKANLGKADLGKTYLRKADLSDADLTNASLSSARCKLARFKGVVLLGTNLCRADLGGADLTDALLFETIFGSTRLSHVKGLASCFYRGPCVLDHRTLQRSETLPSVFLRGCGLPESLIDYLPSMLDQAIDYYSCFISYSHVDRAFARRLHDQLQGRGIRCWLDDHQILPGEDILERIQQGIRLWDKVLLCCSEASLKESPWVNREIDKALQKEEQLWKQRGQEVLSLIPLDLDGYMFKWDGGRASELTRRLAPDFTGWESDNAKFEEQFERVVKALRADEGGREPPPEPKL